jgi:hypothetical protein
MEPPNTAFTPLSFGRRTQPGQAAGTLRVFGTFSEHSALSQ